MNIWTGLLFLEGAIADTPLARELAAEPTQDVAPHAVERQDQVPVAAAPWNGCSPQSASLRCIE